MNQFITPILTLVLLYGYPIIILEILLGYLGLPVPVDISLLAAGSFTADGTLNMYLLILIATITAIIGDVTQYIICRKYGMVLINKTFLKKGLTPSRVRKMEKFLQRWGAWCIFFTRWLFSPLGVPLNITAGLVNYSFRKFVITAAIGEFLWASIYVSVGHLFGSNWSTIVDYINNVPQLFVFLGSGVVFIYAAVRLWLTKR
jgi:membrane protein DedA with SNARE-associated domain